jgi:hypothetical protein
MENAAQRGHLNICQWLRAAQCDWDEGACDAAARGGHLDILRWLFDSGCPHNGTMLWLIGLRDNAVARFLMQQQAVPQRDTALTAMLNWAGGEGNLAAAKHMRRHGAAWPAVLDGKNSHTPWCGQVLECQWARAESCTFPTE